MRQKLADLVEDRATGPRGRKRARLHRRGIRRHPQHRAHVRLAEAAGRAQDQRRSGHCAPAPQTRHVPGATLYLQAVQDLRIGGRAEQCAVPVHAARRQNLRELTSWAPRILQRLRTLPELADVNSDQQDKGLKATLTIDREHRVAAGHHPADDRQHSLRCLRPAAGLHHLHAAQPVPRGHGSWSRSYWQRPETLRDIYVRSSNGTQVPLSAFTSFTADQRHLR